MKTHIIWLCVSVAALVVGLQFAKKEIQIVEKPVTKEVVVEKPVEVIKEVPKEVDRIVEKRIEVPAEIPDSYKLAKRFYDSFVQAGWFAKNEILKEVPSVRVVIFLNDQVKSKIAESELKDSIELALRKNGVTVKDDSGFFLEFAVDGIWDDANTLFSYMATLTLRQATPVLRSGGFKMAPLAIWENSYICYAGSQKVSDGISGTADKLVISFSNAYLSANSK